MTNLQPERLIAEDLVNDPRIAQAKSLILETVLSHRKQLTGIRPPLQTRKQGYQETLAEFANYRGANLWFPYLGSGIGNGSLVELADGSVKYDFICGIGTHYWGHSHPVLIEAGINAAISDIVMQGHLQQNINAFNLSKLLVDHSKMDHCFFTTSGAMANENALKIALQKNYPATRILAFDHCFVGRTLAISQITDKPSFREGLPRNVFVDYVPFFNPADPEGSTQSAVDILKKHIARYPKEHSIMCLEMVQGEGGFNVGSTEFFKKLIKILRENNIAVFADEVQTFGRTTELFAFQYFGLQDDVDIVTIGKLSQTCATLFKSNYKPRPGLLSQTFTASTSAIEASLALLKELINGCYFGSHGKISKLHAYFASKLSNLAHKHPQWVQGPFGIGSMIAFTPYDGSTQRVISFVHRLFDAGVISFIAGTNPTRVRFLVPVGAVSESDIDHVVQIIGTALREPKET
jgi:4-aminobutyrate aminotransferase-like enzyme